jgi:hypothetical protein
MSYAAQNLEIQARFKAAWGTTTPVSYPNVSFTPPSTAWVRLTILSGEESRLTFGAETNNYRNVGVIVIQVFTPANQGNAAALALADQAAAVFRGWCGATVRCRSATMREIGPDAAGKYQVNISIPFQRDELH